MPRESGASSTPRRSFCSPHPISALEYWISGQAGRRRLRPPSIIIPQIFREAVGLVEIVPIIEIAIQQGAGLALVIRRDVVGLRQAALKNIAIILIVRLRADEDAHAVGR